MISVAESFVIRIADVSAAGEVRRKATALSAMLGFDETDQGTVSVVAAEAAKNIAIHAREGEVFVRTLREGEAVGLELLAVDRGPGIEDVTRAMRDGFSSAGTAGIGLERCRACREYSTSFPLPERARWCLPSFGHVKRCIAVPNRSKSEWSS
jgi:anti-sigma regulatory factor (Ser/Thr protein kinase)